MTSLRRAILFVVVMWSAVAAPLRADVKLPTVFSTHMVVQRDAAVPVWGWAAPGEAVTVSLAERTKETVADKKGTWRVDLDKLTAGGPHVLTVKGRNTVTVRDVLVGEVWLASGQSNMVHIMPYVRDAAKEMAAADYPQVRIFTAAGDPAETPQENCRGSWLVMSPTTADDVSAVAYFFARDVHRALGVPVGVVNASLGSTPIEAWTSREAQQPRSELQELLASWEKKIREYDPSAVQLEYERLHQAWEAEMKKPRAADATPLREPKKPIHPRVQPQRPAAMYNAMIAPLAPYGIRGVIWYQGEYNTQREDYAALYRHQLPLLIDDWRTRWDKPELPFGWVQLPNFDVTTREPVMTGWPLVREGMLQSLKVPHTGMAITIDLGDAEFVHPMNKQGIAERLSLWARAEVYGEKIPWSGPVFAGFRIAGHEIELRFRHADGLKIHGEKSRGFVVAGRDGKWHDADVRIDGDKAFASSSQVPQPVAARYSWSANPDGNLRNGADLPASPFRTDHD